MATIVSIGDAEQMFLNTIVEVEGVPHAVHAWTEEGEKMQALNILTGASVALPRDADLLLSPTHYQLGYQQIGSQAIFLQRRPVRQYRVGWCDRNVDGMSSVRDIARSKASMESFKRMLNRDYPSMARAFQQAVQKEICLAFDRQFAVDYRGRLIYKGNQVGTFDGERISLMDNRKYLAHQLEQLKNV